MLTRCLKRRIEGMTHVDDSNDGPVSDGLSANRTNRTTPKLLRGQKKIGKISDWVRKFKDDIGEIFLTGNYRLIQLESLINWIEKTFYRLAFPLLYVIDTHTQVRVEIS